VSGVSSGATREAGADDGAAELAHAEILVHARTTAVTIGRRRSRREDGRELGVDAECHAIYHLTQ